MTVVESLEQAMEVLSSEKRVIVCFVARWCPPCRMLNLNLEEFYEANPEVDIYKIDANVYKDLAKEYNATSVPVTFIVENGKVLKSHNGYLDVEGFNRLFYSEE